MAKRITFEVPNDTSIVQQNNHFSASPVENGLYYGTVQWTHDSL